MKNCQMSIYATIDVELKHNYTPERLESLTAWAIFRILPRIGPVDGLQELVERDITSFRKRMILLNFFLENFKIDGCGQRPKYAIIASYLTTTVSDRPG